MLRKNAVLETTIQETVFPNKGLVYINGEKILIHDGLQGQRVRIKITRKRKNRTEARILEILEPSPLEQNPSCLQFGSCGGCTYLHLPYEAQLEMKQSQVLKLLENAGISGFTFKGIEPSPGEFAYRNKMEYTFGDSGDGELALGLHRKRMRYEISPTPSCQLVDGDFLAIQELVLAYFRKMKTPFYHKKSHQGVLRNLVIRKAGTTGEILINLVTTSQQILELDELAERLRTLDLAGQIIGFLHTINDGKGDTIQADALHTVFGKTMITELILGLQFKVSAFSFFQTNSHGAEKLFSLVREYAGSQVGVAFDLYCGTGTIAQILSPLAEKVVGIEIVPEAIEAAKANAKTNGLTNCRFIAGDVLSELDHLDEQPDLIVLDPPRGGIHPKALEKIIQLEAPRIIYVSCQPVSLAKDLQVLAARGYQATTIKCMDMFPHTPHVECVVSLSRVDR
ncbi:MAG: 23S rRNA (uracil(1939)-C(5))-methyltransferase RlmD [Firmicutes bacterium]|nr:23S rRNA (uracil(1939)-C(5))-methyltransferase RlmD [Bacillota bacterium]